MRRDHVMQLTLSSVEPSELIGRYHSRDDIDKLILGLHELFCQPSLRSALIEQVKISTGLTETGLGREGMSYWSILVLGLARVTLAIDYDRLQNLANNHAGLRQVMGHGDWDMHKGYSASTLKENVKLLNAEALEQINTIVVQHGRKLAHPYSKNQKLVSRCDSFVAKTDVHFPTDISLLYDALRKLIELLAQASQAHKLAGMRQYKYYRATLKQQMHTARNAKKSKDAKKIEQAHQQYITHSQQLLAKLKVQQDKLLAIEGVWLPQKEWRYYHDTADKLLDQIDRRILKGESIPHDEKIFSIFEPHTEWICKGKSGVPVELGVKLAIVQDQHQFILHHRVMEKEQDVSIAVKVVEAVRDKFGEIDSISFDRGFWSPDNELKLSEWVRKLVLPKKGYRSQARQQIEREKEYKQLKRAHSSIESGINEVQVHGLEKVPDRGIIGYKRYIALGILGFNVHKLGAILLAKHYKQIRKRAA